MTRIGQTVYIKVVVKEITIVKVSRETFIEIVSKEVVFRVVDLIIDIIYYHCSLNKRSIIYIGSLNIS
jgi:hypothetical protein